MQPDHHVLKAEPVVFAMNGAGGNAAGSSGTGAGGTGESQPTEYSEPKPADQGEGVQENPTPDASVAQDGEGDPDDADQAECEGDAEDSESA